MEHSIQTACVIVGNSNYGAVALNNTATMAIRHRWEGTFFDGRRVRRLCTELLPAVLVSEIEPHAAPETFFYIHGAAAREARSPRCGRFARLYSYWERY